MTSKRFGISVIAAAVCVFPVAYAASSDDAGQSQQPERRPNVLVWMMDDVGYAQLSSYGGLVNTPNVDRVADLGLRYANSHTAPICSASRASFLTGRMPHSVHVGGHSAAPLPQPGYDAQMPASAGSIAANLRKAGYTTFALGKWDHLPSADNTQAGPFNNWPTGQGFDKYFGFLAADMDNWSPTLIRGTSPLPTPVGPDYHLNRDLADNAITMINARSSRVPAAPFFMYWATGTAHSPHHAPKEWIERYKGKFDMGWDQARQEILKNQISIGLVPKGTELAPRPAEMPAWDTLNADQKRLYARQMEVFAASLSYADEQFGRILDALEARGELGNTIILITSDNGASAEGSRNGTYNEATFAYVGGSAASEEENLAMIDKWGGPNTYPHYSFGWAVAGNTPLRYYKQTTYEGGIRVPLVVAWPQGIRGRGEIRNQFVHVSDVAPTILEAAHVPLAPTINDVPQTPMEGLSFAYSFADQKAVDRKQAQYFELYGNKGLWSHDWVIVTAHRLDTWNFAGVSPHTEPWELYDLKNDLGQVNNLATKYPERVTEMARLFDEQAQQFHVYPISNVGETLPYVMQKRKEEAVLRGGQWRYPGPVDNVSSFVAPPVTHADFTMTAKLDLTRSNITGPIFSIGGSLGGMGFYLREGRPVLLLNTLSGETTEVATSHPLPQGSVDIELDFRRVSQQGEEPSEYHVGVKANGQSLLDEKVLFDMPGTFVVGSTFAVGNDDGSTVMSGYSGGVPFAGKISDVVFDFRPRTLN